MASEGKQSPFTFKNIALSAVGIVLTSWAIPKALDYFLDTTLLAMMSDWLLGVWKWLLLEKPQQNGFIVLLNIALLFFFCMSGYTYYLYLVTKNKLDNAEEALTTKALPADSELTRPQIMVLHNLANLVQNGLPTNTTFLRFGLGAGTGLESLELEIALEQLKEKGFVQFTISTAASTPTPSLTLKGKEFVLARRKRNAELAEQKKKNATSESKAE